MVTVQGIERAVQECERFMLAASRAKTALKANHYASISGCRETAACKRASMDLSRALADLRKGGRG